MNNPYASPAATSDAPPSNPYLSVSRRKLIIMMLGTSGLYAIYWSYRQWKAYTAHTGGSQWAWARGWLWPFFSYNLFCKVDGELRKREQHIIWSPRFRGAVVPPTYLAAVGLSAVLNPLPGAVIAIMGLAINTYLLLGTLPAINCLAGDPSGQNNSRLSWLNGGWLLIGVVMWGSVILAIALALEHPELFSTY